VGFPVGRSNAKIVLYNIKKGKEIMSDVKVDINGSQVSVGGELAKKVTQSQPFKDWVKNLDPEFQVKKIKIQSVDMAGKEDKKRVLFVKFKAEVTDKKGNCVPGIVFMRGGSVVVLVVLCCEGEEYTILTLQPRVPVGKFAFPGLPAGMLDGSGNFKSVATKELAEEAEVIITEQDLFDATAYFLQDRWQGNYPSAGGCDEFHRLFIYRKEISRDELDKLHGKLTGAVNENERIVLKVIRLDQLLYETPSEAAVTLKTYYDELKKLGVLSW